MTNFLQTVPYILIGLLALMFMITIHEFGHYSADLTFGSITSLDLAEVQSQGNEMMFMAYLQENNLIDEDIVDSYVYNEIWNITSTVLVGCAINELEQYAYTQTFTQDSLESKWNEIQTRYGFESGSSSSDYMYRVLLNYHVYYISYAVSALASLQIYAKSLVSLTDAKTAYNSICKKESKNERFLDSLTNAGLGSIFEESSYQLIASIDDLI